MGKLHELLAVEPDLAGEAQRLLTQREKLFKEGEVRFKGIFRTYKPLEETGEDFEPEITKLATTVRQELEGCEQVLGAWIDASVQKEVTNTRTKADVVIDGQMILQGLPATALLNLEGKLAKFRKLYAAIPTIDPTRVWEWNKEHGAFVSSGITYRTQKVMKTHVEYEATPEHPAQVKTFRVDERAGTWTTTEHSGMLAPTDKWALLERLDKLIAAVKQARQRANTADVEDIHVGKEIFNFINGK